MKLKLPLASSLIASLTLAAAEPATGKPDVKASDKSGYTLLKPTPIEMMREMSTDRPDKTESAYTVDAGHFQVEADVITISHDHDKSGGGDVKVDSYSIAPVNFKVGLFNNVDLQTVIDTYNVVRTKDNVSGIKERQDGFGDITSRLKINLWGNDGGSTALAIMPFVKYPTSQDDIGNSHVEGGIIVPFAVELPAGFGMGLMTEFDFNQDDGGRGHYVEFVNSITVSHDIYGKLGGYLEFFSAVSKDLSSEWVGTVDVGFTYALTDNIQLDAGVNIGVTDAAEDLNPFFGISIRF